MSDLKWIVGKYDEQKVQNISKSLGVLPLTAKLILRRGFESASEALKFIKKDISGFHSPFLMKDMEKAVEIIKDVKNRGGKVLIWGDYDVDGVTSTTVLLKYLKSHGIDAEYYIPRRLDEGYGLNNSAIENFAKRGGKLLITVDCGITADSEIAFAKSLGLLVVVTDHHECREKLPPADAVVNPKRHDCTYPFKELAGVGVAFKLVCACETVFTSLPHMHVLKNLLKDYSDLTAIGTIADVMPITDENRLIVSSGLDEISHTSNAGLTALIDESGIYAKSYKKKKISSTTIGFILAPKINAAGRISTSEIAVELFLTESREEAARLAHQLSCINKERQTFENEILIQAVERIEKDHDFQNEKIIILSDDNWHHGVIGIVASRITEKYNLPAILVSFKNEGHENSDELGKGSGRSIRGLNIVESLAKCSDILIKYGGHELAAGLSVSRENFDAFKKRMNEYAVSAFSKCSLDKNLEIDCSIDTSEITIESVDEISKLEPFGLSNPAPLFCCNSMHVVSMTSIGENKHTKMLLKKDGKTFVALLFGRQTSELPFLEHDNVDIAFNMDVNNFKSQQTVQLIVRDIKLSKPLCNNIQKEYEKYLELKNGCGKLTEAQIPDRDHFRAVYTMLKKHFFDCSASVREIDICHLIRLIKLKFDFEISLSKALLVFDVFEECGIIKNQHCNTPLTRHILTDSLQSSSGEKFDLVNTKIMQNLYSRKQ